MSSDGPDFVALAKVATEASITNPKLLKQVVSTFGLPTAGGVPEQLTVLKAHIAEKGLISAKSGKEISKKKLRPLRRLLDPEAETAKPKPAPKQAKPSKKPVAKKQTEKPAEKPGPLQYDDEQRMRKHRKKEVLARKHVPRDKQAVCFRHLPHYEPEACLSLVTRERIARVHPAVKTAGIEAAGGFCTGDGARCAAMLRAFAAFFADFGLNDESDDTERDLTRALDRDIQVQVRYLNDCRPKSPSMGVLIKRMKGVVSRCATERLSAVELRQKLEAWCHEQVDKLLAAQTHIAMQTSSLLRGSKGASAQQGEAIEAFDLEDAPIVVATFGRSSLVERAILQARRDGVRLRVIVLDEHTRHEGCELARALLDDPVPVHVTLSTLSAVSHVMDQVTHVLVGANAIFANGFVQCRVGYF
ncbi:MAG: hypothetical protein MHM6MM_005235, partial [Cercozoa sp. M6MM]